MKTKKISVLLILMVLSLVLLSSCSKKEEVLRIGMELKYPPFETVDENGDPTGASVRLAEALGKYLDREIVIIDTPYPSLVTSLESGSIDLIISSMTITPAREEVVDFSDPYTNSQLMMLVHVDSEVKHPDDLNQASVIIASKTGTIGALWAMENAPLAQIVNIDEEASAVLEVAQGKADVFIYDPLSIIRHQENYPDTTLAILEPLPNTKGWGIALRKGQEDLKAQLNAFIKEAKTDGTYDAIRQEFLQDKIKEFEAYGLDFFF